VLRVLWPNSWRVGLQVLSSFVTTLLLSVLCTEFLNLADYQAYGLSIQVANIIQGISAVWVTVKWPLVDNCVPATITMRCGACFAPGLAAGGHLRGRCGGGRDARSLSVEPAPHR